MARYVLRQATRLGWVRSSEKRSSEIPSSTCVALQTTQGDYVFEPPNTNSLLTSAIRRLNDKIAFTMASEITASVIRNIPPQQKYLPIEQAGIRIPIISSLEDVGPSLVFGSRCCILLKEKLVLVWSDDVGAIVQTGTEIEQHLLSSVSTIAEVITLQAAR
jgi:hypothetical protein